MKILKKHKPQTLITVFPLALILLNHRREIELEISYAIFAWLGLCCVVFSNLIGKIGEFDIDIDIEWA